MEIITASCALPMTNDCPAVKNGAIAVEMGRVHAFGELGTLKDKFPSAPVKKNDGAVLMPGLVNAHCHLDLISFFDSLGAENAESGAQSDFTETLVASIDFKHDAKPEVVMSGIQRGINRLIETGVTCVGDMTHFEGTFKIIREMGMRAVVFPEILAGRGEAAQQKFEIALALVEKYMDASHDLVRVGVGPYAPYLLSRNLLKIISQHAKDASIPVMIHTSESFAEMEFFFDSEGPIATEVFPTLGWKELPPAQRKTPITYLADIGFFEAPTIIVGGLHLSQQDFPALTRHLVRVVWCPSMNAAMKHGAFPYAKYTELGIPVGLGTETWHGPQAQNLWNDIRLAASPEIPSGPTAKEALKLATVGSSRALGLDHLIGQLTADKRADYIIVHLDNVHLLAGDAVYDALVAKTEPHHVKTVVVGGNILKAI